MKKIAVFGATGQTGRQICRLLLNDQSFEVIACARKTEKLKKLENTLDPFGTFLKTITVDLNTKNDLDQVINNADVIVGATSRWQDSLILATKAIQASKHYCGIYLSHPDKWRQLRELDKTCRKKNVMIVEDCGTHPGLPAAMIKWMNLKNPLHSAWVGGKFDLEWNQLGLVSDTVTDFLAEIESTNPSVLIDGNWKRGFRYSRKFNFSGSANGETCIPMLMEEVREVAQSRIVSSTGFYIAGFGFFVDYVIIPASILLNKINRRISAKLFGWGLKQFASRPSNALIQLDAEATGSSKLVHMLVSHDDPYYITAASSVVTIKQILDTPKAGVWTQGSAIEPTTFFSQLQELGITVNVEM